MAFEFKKATKKQSKLRMALQGPSGAGKSRSALEIAKYLAPGGRIALIDTERGSASKYSHLVNFDVCEISDNYHPDRLVEAVYAAASSGYDTVVVDSMTHFWNGPGGFLELVDDEVKKMAARGNRGDSHAAWKTVDVVYKRMVHKLMTCPIHLIMTMRAKQEYARETGDNGKTKVKRLGMAPEMRDNFVYEADIEGMIDMEHNLVVGKNRCDSIDGKVFPKPGKELADLLRTWLDDGAPSATVEAQQEVTVNSEPAPQSDDEMERALALHEVLTGFDFATSKESLDVLVEKTKELKLTESERPKFMTALKAAKARIASEQQ